MPTEILKTFRLKKNVKLGRIKTHQRVFIMPEPEPVSLDPDSILINKIIKNIKQEARGKKHEEKMTRKERREMEIEKITIPLEAYENMKEGIESSNFNLDHPEFIFEDIQGDIRDGNYFDASMRLMELHHQQLAIETINKIEKERNTEKDEKKNNGGSNS